MNDKQFEVIFYEKIDGTVPALDFIESLDPKLKAKMYHAIILLEENEPSFESS